MGTMSKGILGAFSGKVGNVVGSTWKGKAVLRSRPGPRSKGSFTQNQLEQQARFRLMIGFLQPLTDLLDTTFSNAKGMSGINKALSYNVVQAIDGNYPDFVIDYAKVQISRGARPLAGGGSCSSPTAAKLAFTWTASDVNNDQAFVVAYLPETNSWIYLQNAALRSAGTATLDATGLSGKAVHTWLGFMSADGKKVSNTAYTGQVTVL